MTRTITALTYSPDGELIAACNDGTVWIEYRYEERDQDGQMIDDGVKWVRKYIQPIPQEEVRSEH